MPDGDATADEPLRERVLRLVLYWLALGALLNGGMLVLQASLHDELSTNVLAGVIGLQTVFLVLPFRKRLGYRRTAWLSLAHLFVMCSYFQMFRGLTPGTVLGSVVFLLLSGLFFGARGVGWAFALSFLSLLASAWLVLDDWILPWQEWFYDPHDPLVWLRYAMVFACYGGAVATGIVLTIDGIGRSAESLHQTLERERRERAQRELVQRELEKSKRLEVLAQFAAGVAHDFNNSLTVITGSAGLIQAESDLPAGVHALADEIAQSAQIGATTVRQLLSLGRTDGGEPELVQLHDLARRSLTTLRQALGDRVTLALEAEAVGGVFVDAGRLRQALLNLAVNARDAMPDGGHWTLRVIERELTQVPAGWNAQPGRYLTLLCSDDGVGMQPEVLDKIFEPFFTTKSAQSGSGLGLAMVRKTFVEAHGFIEVESSPGAGTTFRLNLPRRADALVSLPLVAAASTKP